MCSSANAAGRSAQTWFPVSEAVEVAGIGFHLPIASVSAGLHPTDVTGSPLGQNVLFQITQALIFNGNQPLVASAEASTHFTRLAFATKSLAVLISPGFASCFCRDLTLSRVKNRLLEFAMLIGQFNCAVRPAATCWNQGFLGRAPCKADECPKK
jgi:hypothetical protein